MHTPFYRHVFKDAWHAAWRNKSLWVLGLLSAFWGVTGLQMVLDWGDAVFHKALMAKPYDLHWPHVTIPVGPVGFSSIAAFVTLIALAAMLLWVVTAARGGIYWALYRVHGGQAKPKLMNESVRVGTTRFWPVLLINAVGRLLIGAVFFVLVSAVAAMGMDGFGTIIMSAIVISVATLVALFVSVMAVFGTIGVVVGEQSVKDAFRHAWQRVSKHWLVILESIVILYVGSALAGIIFFAAIIAVILPLVMVLVITSVISSMVGFWLVAVPAGVCIILGCMLLGGWYTTFEAATWVSLYRRTEGFSPIPKLYRFAATVRAKLKK